MTNGFTTCGVSSVPTVWPSAGAFATISLPTVNTPPGRLSTTTCCPHDSLTFCATKRVMMSAVAPGGIGTIQRSGLLGYACDSPAATGASAPPIPHPENPAFAPRLELVYKSAVVAFAGDNVYYALALLLQGAGTLLDL